jgi:hypothetical protein
MVSGTVLLYFGVHGLGVSGYDSAGQLSGNLVTGYLIDE